METSVKRNDYPREDYYFGMLEDVRNIFIGYGRYLEHNSIPQEGTIEDYENFLMFGQAQEKEFDVETSDTEIKDYFENLPQKEIERMDFEDYLLESIKWDYDVIIIKSEDWEEFHNNLGDEDYEMKLEYSNGVKFYEKFKELTGIGLIEFDECFVSAKYIDEETKNSMNLIVKINGVSQRFIIDCV